MSLTNSNDSNSQMPDSIALGELAIAASRIGFPMTIFYRYFPADVSGGLWQFYLRHLGPESVHCVGRERDVKQLETGKKDVQLVLIVQPRLYRAVAWALILRASRTEARPAIFCKFPGCDPDEDPAVTLVLHGRQGESEKVADYLAARSLLDREEQPKQFSGPVVFDQVVERALDQSLQHRRDRKAVRSLIAGEIALNATSRPPGATQCARVSVDAYRRVYGLLQRPVVRAMDEPFDPLARDMVNRANAYLLFRQASTQQDERHARDDPSDANDKSDDRPEQERKITRRELTDLGNTKGKTVRGLMEFLLDLKEGLDIFCHLGVTSPHRKDESWPSRDPESLARLLIPWSQKQVRDHFHRLYQQDLITAKRAGANKPWQYDVPETLVDGHSAFRRLPRPESLFSGDSSLVPQAPAPLPVTAQLPVNCPNLRADLSDGPADT